MTETPEIKRTEARVAAQAPVNKSLVAEAASAHARINIPVNLENWKHLDAEIADELLWFHQHILNTGMNFDDAGKALDYDRSTIFRILKGTYTGSWPRILEKIQSYRKLYAQREMIQQNTFAENSISRLICGGLNYAMANNSIAMIVGESRLGKTVTGHWWVDNYSGGRAVMVTAPPIGGLKAFMRVIARAVGVNKNLNMSQTVEALYRAFNRNRFLLVDEAHRCLPNDVRTDNPPAMELLRDLHDITGCGVGIMATKRLPNRLEKGSYQYEQLVGRIGMPIVLPTVVKRSDVEPIITQFVAEPNEQVVAELLRVANQPGRLGIMVENLKVASRLAASKKQAITNADVINAIAIRRQMMGDAKGGK